ncbi:phage tail protein [Stanieria cyanosphaera]|nr:phage tail protein [Stanieria cyanosphaera]
MTSSNGNNSDRDDQERTSRLDRIEAIIESNSRARIAMMEQRATDRLEHEERMRFLEENQRQIIQTQRGIANLLSSLDEDRPTIRAKINGDREQS